MVNERRERGSDSDGSSSDGSSGGRNSKGPFPVSKLLSKIQKHVTLLAVATNNTWSRLWIRRQFARPIQLGPGAIRLNTGLGPSRLGRLVGSIVGEGRVELVT